jgi:two-component system, NarL family, nitrate/nitrite response regulator NarL
MGWPANQRHNILLVDDDPAFRQALAHLLAKEPSTTIVGQCGTASEALELLGRSHANLVLLDANLGNERAIDFVIEAKKRRSTARILVITAGVSIPEALELLRYDIAGILHKNRSGQDMCQVIRRVAAGEFWLEERYLQTLQSTERSPTTTRPPLTNEQKKLIRFILGGFSNREIASQLCISECAVADSVRQLFKELSVGTRAQMVRVALERYSDEL